LSRRKKGLKSKRRFEGKGNGSDEFGAPILAVADMNNYFL
jgi:hypothetical protein